MHLLFISICKFLKSWNTAKVGVKHQSINEFFNVLMKTTDFMCPQTVIDENTYFMFPNFQRTFYLATLTWILKKALDFSFYFWLKIDMSDWFFVYILRSKYIQTIWFFHIYHKNHYYYSATSIFIIFSLIFIQGAIMVMIVW